VKVYSDSSIQEKVVKRECTRKKIPRTESLTIPTDTRAAFAFIIKSWTVSGFSDEHPGGTTGRVSWKLNFSYSQQYLALHFSTINLAWREILKYYQEKGDEHLLHNPSIHHRQSLFPIRTIIIVSTQWRPCPEKHLHIVRHTIKQKTSMITAIVPQRIKYPSYLRSPCVKAPRDSNLLATIDAKRRSPPRLVNNSLPKERERERGMFLAQQFMMSTLRFATIKHLYVNSTTFKQNWRQQFYYNGNKHQQWPKRHDQIK
jgi:hypothetical protein